MSKLDEVLFSDKKISDILEEIYNSHKLKNLELVELQQDIKTRITGTDENNEPIDPGTISILSPVLVNYVDLSIKNDENLIKMVTIAQKIISTSENTENNFYLSVDERKFLLDKVKEDNKEILLENKIQNE